MSLAAALLLWTLAAPAGIGAPATTPNRGSDHDLSPPAGSKKAAYLASKGRRRRGRPLRAGRRARRPVYAVHAWTHEILVLDPLPPATVLDRFLRDHFTGSLGGVPPKLVATAVDTAHTFDTRKILVISGYRSPKYNLWLRKKGREVARRSQHTRAKALDFALPERDVRRVYRHLLRTHDGGVGFYPVTGFVHVDLGRKRTWKGT